MSTACAPHYLRKPFPVFYSGTGMTLVVDKPTGRTYSGYAGELWSAAPGVEGRALLNAPCTGVAGATYISYPWSATDMILTWTSTEKSKSAYYVLTGTLQTGGAIETLHQGEVIIYKSGHAAATPPPPPTVLGELVDDAVAAYLAANPPSLTVLTDGQWAGMATTLGGVGALYYDAANSIKYTKVSTSPHQWVGESVFNS